MAKRLCPSCGKPYNGKRCSHCLYENFTEEITHGLHTHQGEPLVIEDTRRRPIPTKDPFECDPRTKGHPRKRGKVQSSGVGKLVRFITALAVLFCLLPVGIEKAVRSGGTPEPDLNGYDTVLFSDEEITISARGEDLEAPEDGISLSIRNDTSQNLFVYNNDTLINGYQLPDIGFYCEVPGKSTTASIFYLYTNYLSYTGADTVQTVSLNLLFCDEKTGEDLFEIGPIDIEYDQLDTEEPPQEMLYSEDGLSIGYLGSFVQDQDAPDFSNLLFCLENNTDSEITVYSTQIQLNGQPTETTVFYCSLPANTKAIERLYLNLLEEESLDDIQSLSMTLGAYSSQEDIPYATHQRDLGTLEVPVH